MLPGKDDVCIIKKFDGRSTYIIFCIVRNITKSGNLRLNQIETIDHQVPKQPIKIDPLGASYIYDIKGKYVRGLPRVGTFDSVTFEKWDGQPAKSTYVSD